MFEEFEKITLDQWRDKLVADLKGKSPSLLEFNDEIENISYRAYYHHSEMDPKNEQPGNFPFKRGFNSALNHWDNLAVINIDKEENANKRALQKLMNGATGLWFIQNGATDWQRVLKNILPEHIMIQFSVESTGDQKTILELIGEKALPNVRFNFDPLANKFCVNSQGLKDYQYACYMINGYAVQQCGANTWQEAAFCLNTGHETLLKLMGDGLNVDEAAACIHFHLGIGGNYFFEIAKIRAFKELWSKVIAAYNPEHACSHKANITAVLGLMNKSLSDPYTNLLRQTTEAMSAIASGVDQIAILPYDQKANGGPSELAERMALNISLILKEESYFDKVLDPVGGSYSLEKLTDIIGEKTWSYFKDIESEGGLLLETCLANFVSNVQATAQLRIRKFKAGEIVGIGINKYTVENNFDSSWTDLPTYIGMNPVILERTIIKKTLHES